jgi:hypothetical protein
MKTKTIKINDYIFVLRFSDRADSPNSIVSSRFFLDDYFDSDMTKKELEKGRDFQQKIYDGVFDEHINKTPFDLKV